MKLIKILKLNYKQIDFRTAKRGYWTIVVLCSLEQSSIKLKNEIAIFVFPNLLFYITKAHNILHIKNIQF
jgi:hypothetical protein